MKERIDLSRLRDARFPCIEYVGFFTRQPDGLYRGLAFTPNGLCVVEVQLSDSDDEAKVA